MDLTGGALRSVRELPLEFRGVLENVLVCEFTVISPSGRPITQPLLPLYDSETRLL